MNETKHCSHCGKPVPDSALGGLCPECMLRVGVGTQNDAAGPNGTRVVNPPPEAPATPSEIAMHFPQLEILECLGRGGMGVVYKARQSKLNRFVALKILAPERETEPRFAERFTREAQALAQLNHPNIVTVYDFGETDGMFYLLMEFVDGVSLRQLLSDRRVKPEEALAIVPKICAALQFAHEQGVVHRDIKPENVLVDKLGRVKIADFGIAKIIRSDSPQPVLTEDQQVIGTPQYMAPEQFETPKTVDHRADIYSLGVVFYEMLTGELPIGKFQPPSRKVHVDVRLDDVVLHSLEKEPDRRYQHASEVKTDVETIATSAAEFEARGAGPEARQGSPALKAVAKRTVSQTFREPSAPPVMVPPVPFAEKARGFFFTTATVFLIGVGLVALLVIGAVVTSMVLPAVLRARQVAQQQATASQHNVVLPPATAPSSGVALPDAQTNEARLQSAAAMVEAFKGQYFAAYSALTEKNDPAAALAALDALDAQFDDFLANVKGTPIEKAITAGVKQLRLVKKALQEGKVEQAKTMMEGLNLSGPQFEKMIKDAAAGADESPGNAPNAPNPARP